MEQKFVSFEDAVEKLGINADRLNELREEGQLRAYRDGKSWKFRTDEIENMVASGVPEPSPPSDIGLVSPDELVSADPIELEDDDLELSLASDDAADMLAPAPAEKSDLDLELELDDTDAVGGGLEPEVDELDDTVTAGASDIELDLDLPESGPSDSILLSEEELGESVSGSPSTIIGRERLEAEDADLELKLDDDAPVTAEQSDVKLAPETGASDVLSSGVAGSGVLDELEKAGGTSAFKDLEEIDLSAESSRVLTPEEVEKAKEVSAQKADATEHSDLELVADSGIGSAAGGSELELEADDSLILEDGSGSDLTLDSGDSGINLISPADSGLALDDIPLEMGGSAILSSLSLEGSDPEISLIADDAGSADEPVAELQTDDDFQLTPLSEAAAEEGDSSSQVIALDGDMEDFGDGAAVLEEDDFAEEEGDVVLSEDFAAEAPAGELDMGYAPVAAAAGPETPYSVLNILGLGSSALLLLLGGTMMLDMIRNIWGWQEGLSLNSALMDAILGWF